MKAVILKNEKVLSSYYKMKLSCDGFSDASPGQFVMIRVNNSYDPFLRRPMSIYKIDKKKRGFEILYQVVGKGTNIMSELKKGDEVDVLGPLGRGFWMSEKIENVIIVAGGIGVAPMVALAEEILKFGVRSSEFGVKKSKISINVFIGGRTKNDILCKDDFKKIGAKVHIATEDGSMGKKGTCVDLLSAFSLQPSAFIFACGPQGMLKAVADIASNKKIPCQVSLDKRMACGTGACLGCVVRVRSSEFGVQSLNPQSAIRNPQFYKCVCVDGPVFDSEEIDL